MVGSEISDEHTPRGDETMMIASALRAKFGEEAAVVAQLQIMESDGYSRAMWEAVLAALSR